MLVANRSLQAFSHKSRTRLSNFLGANNGKYVVVHLKMWYSKICRTNPVQLPCPQGLLKGPIDHHGPVLHESGVISDFTLW